MVCRISECLLNLQQHGNSDYVGWVLRFDCFAKDILKDLEDQAKEMENDLLNWKEAVVGYRNDFYELNYYTTQQLLILREEIGKLRNSADAGSSDGKNAIMLSLLQSLSRDVTLEYVRNEVQALAIAPMEEELVANQECEMAHTHTVHEEPSGIVHAGSVSSNDFTGKPTPIGDKGEIMETDLVQDILTSTAHDKPSFSEADLTDAQRKIMINIIRNYGYSRNLILLGLEKCDKPEIEDEVADWCEMNGDVFELKSDVDTESLATTESYSEEQYGSDGRCL